MDSPVQAWWMLTEEEADRLNPPIVEYVPGDDGEMYESVIIDDKWQPVGYIPSPRTRLGWFIYHVIHGLAMRYPLHKVLGFAISNTDPQVDNA